MEKEYINNETNEIMTKEEAIDWLKEYIGYNLEDTSNIEKMMRQTEMEEILLDAYFWTQEARERIYEKNGIQVVDIGY